MEDREKSKSTKAESIIELTPDMEVTDESQMSIIELTDVVDGPDEVTPLASPAAETAPEIDPPVSRPARGSAFSSAIEQEVEAAFDYVQSPIWDDRPAEKPAPADRELMDKFSDIPQMVDDALDGSGTPDDDMEEAVEEAAPVEDAIGLDTGVLDGLEAAEPDMARSAIEPYTEDDEIIELTDIVDPSELEVPGAADDEIIELTDIVNPGELQEAGRQADEIVELTDIVEPAELQSDAGAAVEDQEYEDLLETIDSLDAEDLLVAMGEEDPGAESIAIEEEAADIPEEAADDALLDSGDETLEEQEYAELLDTIDSLDPDDLLVSVDEAGLLDSDETAGQAAGEPTAPEEDELLTLTDVLNRHAVADDTGEKPPVEEAGAFTREVEEETGRKVRTLTDEEIEAAVERILKSKYADTIERLIANAVEKAVNREIEILKKSMLDDDDPLA